MRYKIKSDILIRTENAAKPRKQFSKYLRSKILSLTPVSASVDFGCGKLRYSDIILKTTDTLSVVDSEIQLTRKQRIAGRIMSIREYLRPSNRIDVYNAAEFGKLAKRFDRAFCINVLSVIPVISLRKRVVRLIADRLKPGGTCLFVVQYRNSDFSRMQKMRNARKWCDGFLIDSLRGFSFYGMISPSKLVSLVSSAGFKIVEQTLNEGSVYLLAEIGQTIGKPRIFEIEEEPYFRLR